MEFKKKYKDYDPKELKKRLSRNVHKEGDGNWYGYSKRLSTPPRFPSPRSRREKGSHYVSSIGATLFPSEDRIFGTTMRDCMEGGVHGKKQKDIGAGSKPSYPRIGLEFDYERLQPCRHFEDYKGGRIPGEALDRLKRPEGRALKSLVKHQDGSSPPAAAQAALGSRGVEVACFGVAPMTGSSARSIFCLVCRDASIA